MDFFYMNFSELFEKKHGKQLFNDISREITIESSNVNSNNYIELIFKVAFYDYFGLSEASIEELIKDTMSEQYVNVKDIKVIYKNSIKEIQKYLQDTLDSKIK